MNHSPLRFARSGLFFCRRRASPLTFGALDLGCASLLLGLGLRPRHDARDIRILAVGERRAVLLSFGLLGASLVLFLRALT